MDILLCRAIWFFLKDANRRIGRSIPTPIDKKQESCNILPIRDPADYVGGNISLAGPIDELPQGMPDSNVQVIRECACFRVEKEVSCLAVP
jgi:hypothetical protein